MVEYLDAAGTQLRFADSLGRGGEGTVYALEGDPTHVAKIYHPQLAASRCEKLETMVSLATPTLVEFACWPLRLVYEARKRTFAGYIMSNLGQCHAIHELYNPKSRRIAFPNASYKLLVHVAGNIARAFAAAHSSGIVVGDVNQNSVMVRADGTVRLIDCDSAQVRAGGKLYRCEVGVPLFTPPELQGCEFAKVDRSEQHDAFGLAVLIFQLLCMGKHPFAGRYLGSGDMPIEKAIEQRRFPYFQNGNSNFVPPPDSVDIRWLAPCSNLFVNAFLGTARPSASQWIDALTTLGSFLRTCSANSAHQFPVATTTCPWCAIEARTGAILFSVAVIRGFGTTINIDMLWSRIVAVSSPPASTGPLANVQPVPPTPEAQLLGKEKRRRRFVGLATSVAAAGMLAAWHPELFVLIIIFVVFSERWASGATATLKQKRAAELAIARKKIDEIMLKWREEASGSTFESRRRDLEKIYNSARRLPEVRATKLRDLQSRARESQLLAYLDRFHIAGAGIEGIGSGRAAKLSAFGIDTAADISPSISVQGFGPIYKQRLLAWRMHLESRFVFDPKRGVDRRDLEKVELEYQREMSHSANTLDGGPKLLNTIANQVVQRRQALQREYTAVLAEQVRAQADLKIL